MLGMLPSSLQTTVKNQVLRSNSTSLKTSQSYMEEQYHTFLSVSLDSRAHCVVVLFRWQTDVGSNPTIDRISFYFTESDYCANKV